MHLSRCIPTNSLAVPYSFILWGLDYRKAGWHPTYMSHLETNMLEKLKPYRNQNINIWSKWVNSRSYFPLGASLGTKAWINALTRFLEMLCLCSHFADSISHRHIQLSREPVQSFLPSTKKLKYQHRICSAFYYPPKTKLRQPYYAHFFCK